MRRNFQIKQERATENEIQRESSVTLVTVCESARQPSSGLSEPVHTTPSVSESEAAMIYL